MFVYFLILITSYHVNALDLCFSIFGVEIQCPSVNCKCFTTEQGDWFSNTFQIPFAKLPTPGIINTFCTLYNLKG